MTVYSTPNCPQCNFLKGKMVEKKMDFTTVYDEEAMRSKGIASVPVLEMDDGRLLDFREALQFVASSEGGN